MEPGELKAVAYLDGQRVATHIVRTAAAPSRLHVWMDDMGVTPVPGDLVFVRARLQDARGNPVALSGRKVQFAFSGGYQIVGTSEAATEAGVASVLVRVGGAKGTVQARSSTLAGHLALVRHPARPLAAGGPAAGTD